MQIPCLQFLMHLLVPTKKTTLILQPIDQGLISSMNKRYKMNVVKRAVNFIESGVTENLYWIDVRVAETWVNLIWQDIELEGFAHCLAKSRIV